MQAADTKKQQALTLTTLSRLYESIQFDNEDPVKEKLLELYEKVKTSRLTVSFCGHFSAGKSSLLNHMIDDKLLPASPIPTSGNLIKLRAGKERAVLHLTTGERVNVPAPYSLEDFQAFSKNTALVETIDVYLSQRINEHIELIDTPGVDSTDEAHQRLTENALHLADTVMYVTDYNHVQSTVNFHFMQHLEELKKPYSLIINQIDKHQDQELSFEAFKERVERSLIDWGLHPQAIYYTTLMDSGLDSNDLNGWLNQMEALLLGQSGQLSANTTEAMASIIEEHLQKNDLAIEEYLEKRGFEKRPEDIDLLSFKESLNHMKNELIQLNNKQKEFIETLTQQVSKAVDSSILMPYETRELARLYLESLESQFKMGFFSTKKKIENERINRLHAFQKAFQKNIETMVWNTRDQLSKAAKSLFSLTDSDLQGIYNLNIESDSSYIQDSVQAGAQITGQYVLTYTENLSAHYKKAMKRLAVQWIEFAAAEYGKKNIEQQKDLETQISQQRDLISKYSEALQLLQSHEAYREKLLNTLKSSNATDSDAIERLEKHYQEHEAAIPELTLQEAINQLERSDKELNEHGPESQDIEPDVQSDTDTNEMKTVWASMLENAADALTPLEEYKTQMLQLLNRADRIKHNEMTIALFGAFSAGKTSFANALLGKKVLPVSPNPTTAVISQIKASNKEFSHNTAQVLLKSEQRLAEDVAQSLKRFKVSIARLSDLEGLLKKIKNDVQTAELKLHYAFLQAVTEGLSTMANHLGTTLTLPLEDAHDMIANEVKSCFIEHVTVYYDAPLTKQGIVLVDTPGADSINARHTDVAFNYIKNADAILFVTYYNHAFSRADREFLIQLGRVKDTFSMDKMFFIINAMDLAESDQELNMVKDYIADQLLGFGIRHPRLFAVSSKNALNKETLKASGIPDFQSSLQSFISNDLLRQTANTGISEVARISHSLKATLRNLDLNDEERKERANEYSQKIQDAKNILPAADPKTLPALQQAISEWFFYVKKRIMQRYLDEFSVYINPAQFQDSSQNHNRHLLEQTTRLIDFLSYDIDQEMRATCLRIEALMNQLLEQEHESLETELISLLPDWEAISKESVSFETAPIQAHLKADELEGLEALSKQFKNSRQFFAQNGQKSFKEDLEKFITKPVSSVIEVNESSTMKFYIQTFEEYFNKEKLELLQSFTNDIESYINQLSANKNTRPLYESVYEKLTILLNKK